MKFGWNQQDQSTQNEELLVSYTPDGSYWTSLFTSDQLDKIKDALAKCGPTLKDAEDCILLLQI